MRVLYGFAVLSMEEKRGEIILSTIRYHPVEENVAFLRGTICKNSARNLAYGCIIIQ